MNNPTPLHASNIAKLNGTYSIASIRSDSIENARGYKYWYYHNFLKEIDRKLIKDTLVIDSTSNYAFQLKTETPKLLQINYIVNDSVFRQRTVKTKLTKDGYLKLKNKNLQILLLPYIFGGIDIKHARITVDANENLLFDVGQHRSGGILVIMLDDKNHKYRRTYKRISDN